MLSPGDRHQAALLEAGCGERGNGPSGEVPVPSGPLPHDVHPAPLDHPTGRWRSSPGTNLYKNDGLFFFRNPDTTRAVYHGDFHRRDKPDQSMNSYFKKIVKNISPSKRYQKKNALTIIMDINFPLPPKK